MMGKPLSDEDAEFRRKLHRAYARDVEDVEDVALSGRLADGGTDFEVKISPEHRVAMEKARLALRRRLNSE